MNEEFGSIFFDGKMIDVDKEDIKKLKEISKKLEDRNKSLEEKAEKVFNQ